MKYSESQVNSGWRETSLGGAKNAVLPIMAACLLIDGEIILRMSRRLPMFSVCAGF